MPYPRGMGGKEARQDPRAINHASTIIKWVIGPRNAPILRRTTIRTRAIRDRQILKHILDTCTTLLLKRFPQERFVKEPTNYTKLSKKIIRQSRRFSKLKPV